MRRDANRAPEPHNRIQVKTVLQLFKIPEARRQITTTLWVLIAYRVGFHIPIPGMDPQFLIEQSRGVSTVFGLLSAFSGSQLGQTVLFALGIMPYISASIIFSVLAKVSPQLEAIQKEGAAGQKKINQWTRLTVVPISLLQALMIWFGFFKGSGLILEGTNEFVAMMAVVFGLMGGAMFVMWLGELITEYGIGNGASLIIMANIISTIPSSIGSVLAQQDEAYNTLLTLVGIWVAIVLVIVFIQKGERRIPIQYARLTRGRRVYGGQRHYLPLKINMAGVMPIIFASALFIVPGALFTFLGLDSLQAIFSDTDGFVYITLYLVLVFGFCFFWNNLMFRPDEIADNLREHGSFIPGIRPGAKTAAYLKDVLQRITLAGAAFLAVIAVIPNFITGNIPGLQGRLAYFLGGTSVLIVVGVAMDMVDRLNAQLVTRNYEGFTKGTTGSGAGWAKQ
ncbi:MAG TPA: preprotein translocase subunit SecY [Planctomycetes bacterium]|nr:preprotein translocase subunit SecY [Planctomycetota bacterium]